MIMKAVNFSLFGGAVRKFALAALEPTVLTFCFSAPADRSGESCAANGRFGALVPNTSSHYGRCSLAAVKPITYLSRDGAASPNTCLWSSRASGPREVLAQKLMLGQSSNQVAALLPVVNANNVPFAAVKVRTGRSMQRLRSLDSTGRCNTLETA
jgi:hypothetical protein